VTDSVDADPGSAKGGTTAATGTDELERLRRLILAVERDRLADVERRLGDPEVRADELSRILPESLARAARHDTRLAVALSTVLDEALAASIKKNRKHLAEALSPAMGPAIRRAIAETLRTMVDSFNQVLQHSLSPRALRWRFEAWQTGRSFAEVVLSHSLVFRVEQIFLVHRKSGLLLQHVAADPAAAHDSDLISGMLTAIQDFVRDSFSVGAEQAVDTMRVGDLAVWVEQTEDAYIAAVIRGSPPIGLRGVLRDALETIRLEVGETLETFSGDSAPFEEVRHHLEGCLQMQVAGRDRRRYWLAPAIVGSVCLLALAVWLVLGLAAGQRWRAYVARLRSEPGILVISENGGVRRSSISGLRDPYAADPIKLLADSGLDAARVSSQWQPFISQDPSIVLTRARAVLQPPASATLALADGTLSASGSSPHRWVGAASVRAVTIPGVITFEAGRLVDEGLTAIRPAQSRLEAVIIRFDVGVAELPRREEASLDQAAAALLELAAVAREAGIALKVDVIGHTDGTGSEGTNVRLSRARAEWVLSALEAKGVRDLAIAILGVGASRPLRAEDTPEDRAFNRSVTFRVAPES
jgi:outer membrane protein OmpA-like peptidoglycan-associated protein